MTKKNKEHISFVDRIQSFAKREKDEKKSKGSTKITMVDEDGVEIELYVVEKTKLNGLSYIRSEERR